MTKLRIAVVASLFALAACGSSSSQEKETRPPTSGFAKKPFEKPMAPVLMPDVVTADQPFADDVEAKEDRLVVPTAGHETMLAKVKVGSVLAGNRSSKPAPAGTGNPYGFLRRVTSIAPEGANTVIVTTKATLDEYLQEGDIVFGPGQRSLLDANANADAKADANAGAKLKTKTLHTLAGEDDQAGAGSGNAEVEINASMGDGGIGVKLSDASIKVGAAFDGYFKVRYRPTPAFPDPPTGVSFKSVLTLDPQFTADIEISGTAQLEAPKKFQWRGPGVFVLLPSPVPVTLRIEPEIECGLSVSGETSYTFNVNIGAHSVDGFEGDAGFDHFDISDRSEQATASGSVTLKSVQSKATGTFKCTLRAVPALLIFDSLGVNGKIGPYVSGNVELCRGTNAAGTENAFTIYEEHGLNGEFNGVVKIPLINASKEFKGAEIDVPLGNYYLLGDENSCEAKLPDSCVGKADGLYCSEIAPYSGYHCTEGQISGGDQCLETQKCKGGSPGAIECE